MDGGKRRPLRERPDVIGRAGRHRRPPSPGAVASVRSAGGTLHDLRGRPRFPDRGDVTVSPHAPKIAPRQGAYSSVVIGPMSRPGVSRRRVPDQGHGVLGRPLAGHRARDQPVIRVQRHMVPMASFAVVSTEGSAGCAIGPSYRDGRERATDPGHKTTPHQMGV